MTGYFAAVLVVLGLTAPLLAVSRRRRQEPLPEPPWMRKLRRACLAAVAILLVMAVWS